ncbi:MAG: putative DNA-binding domain-containing protein [Sandaracinaceae bacterium]|nr:putative DNA-binding domain-containing protein [Sandaracinaceae bacterium]
MRLADAQRTFVDVCFTPAPDERLALLRSQPERLRLYRNMVQERLIEMIESAIPRTVQRLGSAQFRAAARDWLAEAPPSSPYIRDVPPEFGSWLVSRSKFLLSPRDGAVLEWELAVWTASSVLARAAVTTEFVFERRPVLNPTTRLLHLSHAVHVAAGAEPRKSERPVTIAVFRHPDTHLVMWRELTEVGASFLQLAGAHFGSATAICREIAARAGAPMDQAFVEDVALSITSWLEERLLLGSQVDNDL